MLLLAFLAFVPRIVLGFLLLEWIWASSDKRTIAIKVFLAGPFGMGVSSLVSFLWIWVGLDLRVYAFLETGVILFLSALTIWKRRSAVSAMFGVPRQFLAKINLSWTVLVAIALLICTGEYWLYAVQNPHGRWDAWSNWNVVARFVYRGGAHWTGAFLRIYDHPDYPFLLAMTNSVTWELLPKESTRVPMLLGFLFTLCAVGLLFGLLYRLRDAKQAALAGIVLLSQPMFAYNGMTQFADMPEAFYFLASIGLLLVFLSSREKSLPILAGFLTGLSAWTKNEGLTFIASNLMVWAFISWRYSKAWMPVLNFLAGLAFPLLVIVLFKVFLAPANDLFMGRNVLALLQDADRYVYIFQRAGPGFWNMGNGPISIVAMLMVYAFLVGRTKFSTAGLGWASLLILFQLLVYFFIYVTTPHDLEWHIRTSLGRLYLHVFPSMILLLFFWLKSPNELLVKTDETLHAPDH